MKYPAPVSGPLASTTPSLADPVRVVGALSYPFGLKGISPQTYCPGCGACTAVDVTFRRCRTCYTSN